jgi:hypothetical protein
MGTKLSGLGMGKEAPTNFNTAQAPSVVSKEHIQYFVSKMSSIPMGCCIAVTQENDITHYGFFGAFNDSEELTKQNKWRFIPLDQIMDYYEDLKQSKRPNPEYSIVIEGNSVTSLELIRKYG